MKLTKNKIFYLIITFLLSFLVVLSSICPASVRANTTTPTKFDETNVLDDLEKDSKFNMSDYPVNVSDFSLKVITIAESKDYELFVYVYVPSGDYYNIEATSINISQEHKNVDFDNFSLSLISKDGVFHKYKVLNFVVKKDLVRYYEFSSIFRAFNEEFGDKTSSSMNLTSEWAYKVGKSYKFTDNLDGGYDVYVEDLELITVTDRYVGFFRYPDRGYLFSQHSVDVHFIAFSTDKPIDQLFEADLIYTSVEYSQTGVVGLHSYDEPKSNKVTVNYKNDLIFDGTGWLYKDNYSWPSIETANSFLETESNGQHKTLAGILDVTTSPSLKDGVDEQIGSQDWVLRFCLTPYIKDEQSGILGHTDYYYTIISDVSILRLAFKFEGITYNLGVVDNKTSSIPGNPSNDPEDTETRIEIKTDNLPDYIKLILGLFLVILLLWFLSATGALRLIGNVLVWVIAAPFKFIKWLIYKIRGD